MSTRAVYTFKSNRQNENKSFSVYKHYDGYPSGAAQWISNAIPFAWKGGRYEPDDFAAAFIAGNKKTGGGDVYMTESHTDHGDLDYYYEISQYQGELFVVANECSSRSDSGDVFKVIFKGTLNDFIKFANK